MEFVEARYRARTSGTPEEHMGRAAVASIVLAPSGERGSFWVHTEAGPMQKAERVVMDNIPAEDVQKIEAGLESEDPETRKQAEDLLNQYVEHSKDESNVYLLNEQSYVEETLARPSGRTMRRSTLIIDRRLEEHFTGETPIYTPGRKKASN